MLGKQKVMRRSHNDNNYIALYLIQIVTTETNENNQLFLHSVRTTILLRINQIWCLLLTEKMYYTYDTMFFCPSIFEQIIW